MIIKNREICLTITISVLFILTDREYSRMVLDRVQLCVCHVRDRHMGAVCMIHVLTYQAGPWVIVWSHMGRPLCYVCVHTWASALSVDSLLRVLI